MSIQYLSHKVACDSNHNLDNNSYMFSTVMLSYYINFCLYKLPIHYINFCWMLIKEIIITGSFLCSFAPRFANFAP